MRAISGTITSSSYTTQHVPLKGGNAPISGAAQHRARLQLAASRSLHRDLRHGGHGSRGRRLGHGMRLARDAAARPRGNLAIQTQALSNRY